MKCILNERCCVWFLWTIQRKRTYFWNFNLLFNDKKILKRKNSFQVQMCSMTENAYVSAIYVLSRTNSKYEWVSRVHFQCSCHCEACRYEPTYFGKGEMIVLERYVYRGNVPCCWTFDEYAALWTFILQNKNNFVRNIWTIHKIAKM